MRPAPAQFTGSVADMERPLMTISITLGGMTVTAKNQQVADLQAAVNDELKLYATKAEVKTLADRVAALEARIDTLEDKPEPVIPPDLSDRVTALEAEPDVVVPPDLTTRVEALEVLIQRVPAENPQPIADTQPLPRPAGIRPDEISLVYDRATLYYHDMILHAQRLDDTRWRLFAQLNFVVVSPVLWTYDEIVEGTPEEVYEHAHRRLVELAELKPQHDAVHERVREMSEGS